MSGFLMEHLVDCYSGKGVLILNNNEVKMGLKDVVYIRIKGYQP